MQINSRKKKLQDPRSLPGQLSRGKNMYPGGAATGNKKVPNPFVPGEKPTVASRVDAARNSATNQARNSYGSSAPNKEAILRRLRRFNSSR